MNDEDHCKICKRSVHCCIFKKKEGFVFVGIKTAEKIRQETGKRFSEFLDFSSLPNKIVDAMKNEEDYLEGSMRFDLLDKKNRLLRLKIKENENCIFLNDKRRCDIYDIRPNICRIYPLWAIRLLNGKLKVIGHDEESKCGIIRNLQHKIGKNTDFEKVLSKKRVLEISKIMEDIEKENIYYKRNIDKFVKTNNL
jgi:Fe-S-cluster containining protein